MGGPLKSAGRQLENAVQNQALIAKAGILRSVGVTRYINARLGEAQKSIGGKKGDEAARERSGVYVQEGPAVIAPDGYVRRSPVQEIRVEPGYMKKRVKKAIGIILLVLIAIGVVALLLRYVSL